MSPSPHAFVLLALILLPICTNAQFGAEQVLLSGAGIQQRSEVDIDGDGDTDILLLLMNGDIVLMDNVDGLGTFTAPITIHEGDDTCHKFKVADIDNDGAADLLVLNGDELSWVRNQGAGDWSSDIDVTVLPAEAANLLLQDVSGDGLPDIVYIDTNEMAPGFVVLMNTGGSFADPLFTPDPVDGLSGEVLLAADLDLVGGTDLVVRTTFGDLMILRNLAGNASEWSPAILSPAGIYTYAAPVAMDVDGDGDLDLVEAAPGAVHWAENQVGEGGAWNVFTEHVLEEVWTAGAGVFGNVGCGRVSLLYMPSNPFLPARWSSWLDVLNDFGYRTELPDLPRGTKLSLADLNGDDKDDLLVERNGDLLWQPSVAVPATTDLQLPELAAHCVFGAPLPLPPAAPEGGRWSGTWVDQGILYRSNLGTGTDLQLAHTYYEPTGCPVAELDTLLLLNGPRTFPEVPTVLCSADAPYQMSSIPDNTTWFGLSEGNVLDPLQFSGGVVACEMVDPSGASCATLLGPFDVWNSLPAEIAPAGPFCVDAGPQVITAQAAPPQGGVWSGDISSSSPFQAVFDPSQGAGYYSVVLRTDPIGPQQCANSDTLVILVTDDHPVVTLPNETVFCQNAGAYPLDASPEGGVWAGPGVVNGELIPALLAVGNNNLTYTATSASGCSTIATWSVQVLDRASIEWDVEDLVFCRTDPSAMLEGQPQGGTWSAPVWTDGEFVPGTVPAGAYPVTYTWTGPNDCLLVSDTITLEVWSDLPVTMDPLVTVCVESNEEELVASHPGTWSGSLVGEGDVLIFSPAALGVGEWPVTITAVADGFCPGTATTLVLVEVCSDVEDEDGAAARVVPNPFRDGFDVRTDRVPMKGLQVLDASGRVLLDRTPMSTQARVELAGIAAGTYLLRISTEAGTSVYRLVKE
ncbi:MAG: T9SS type A sorting domain-containing protein [Flavobacteriales bacterium]